MWNYILCAILWALHTYGRINDGNSNHREIAELELPAAQTVEITRETELMIFPSDQELRSTQYSLDNLVVTCTGGRLGLLPVWLKPSCAIPSAQSCLPLPP